jgi:hypothetical protein
MTLRSFFAGEPLSPAGSEVPSAFCCVVFSLPRSDPRSALNPLLILEPLNAPFGQTTSPGGTRGVSDGLDAPTGGVGSGYLCLAPPSDGQLV